MSVYGGVDVNDYLVNVRCGVNTNRFILERDREEPGILQVIEGFKEGN